MIPAKPLDRTISNIKYALEKYYVRMGLTPLPKGRVCRDFSNPPPFPRDPYVINQRPLRYLDSLLTNQNSVQEEIKCRLKAGNSYYSVQTLLSSRLLSKNLKIKIYKTIILQRNASNVTPTFNVLDKGDVFRLNVFFKLMDVSLHMVS